MKEIFRDINGYNGLYQISNLGRVKSLKCGGERILKLKKNNGGYLQVCFRKNLTRKFHSVHRLVAEMFLLNFNDKPQVNHLNGVKTDNNVNNLEMVTQQENIMHAIKTGLINPNTQASFGLNPRKEVEQYDLNGVIINKFLSVFEAQKNTKIDRSNISKACRGKYETAGGYVWKYKNEPPWAKDVRLLRFSIKNTWRVFKRLLFDKKNYYYLYTNFKL